MHARHCVENFHGSYFAAAKLSVKTSKICPMRKFPAIQYNILDSLLHRFTY